MPGPTVRCVSDDGSVFLERQRRDDPRREITPAHWNGPQAIAEGAWVRVPTPGDPPCFREIRRGRRRRLRPVRGADPSGRTVGPRLRSAAFGTSRADALRSSIAKACRATGIPLLSPHDLRHRLISLLHLRGVPWARIGEQVGQRNLASPRTRTRTSSGTKRNSTARPSSRGRKRPIPVRDRVGGAFALSRLVRRIRPAWLSRTAQPCGSKWAVQDSKRIEAASATNPDQNLHTRDPPTMRVPAQLRVQMGATWPVRVTFGFPQG